MSFLIEKSTVFRPGGMNSRGKLGDIRHFVFHMRGGRRGRETFQRPLFILSDFDEKPLQSGNTHLSQLILDLRGDTVSPIEGQPVFQCRLYPPGRDPVHGLPEEVDVGEEGLRIAFFCPGSAFTAVLGTFVGDMPDDGFSVESGHLTGMIQKVGFFLFPGFRVNFG